MHNKVESVTYMKYAFKRSSFLCTSYDIGLYQKFPYNKTIYKSKNDNSYGAIAWPCCYKGD